MNPIFMIGLAALSHIAYDIVKGCIKICRKVHAKRMSKKAVNRKKAAQRTRQLESMAAKNGMSVEDFKALFK